MATNTGLHAAKTLGGGGETSKGKQTYPHFKGQLLIMVLREKKNTDPELLDLQLGNLPIFEYWLKFFVNFNVTK